MDTHVRSSSRTTSLFVALGLCAAACSDPKTSNEGTPEPTNTSPSSSSTAPQGTAGAPEPGAPTNPVPEVTGPAILDPAVIDDGGLAAGGTNHCQAKASGPDCRYTYLDPPAIEFTDIALGVDHGCGVGLDGTVTCWGDADEPVEPGEECRFNECGQGVPPAGTYTRIAATDSTTCALDPAGAMSCWGTRTMGLAGTFVDLDGSTEALCGLQTDGVITCTGGVPAPPTAGPYTQVAVGPTAVCGVKQGGIDCSGLDNKQGDFARVAVGEGFACGLLIDGTPYCWGDGLRILPPGGPLTALVATDLFACGLHTDGTLECWGEGQEGGTDNSTCPLDHAVLSGTLQGAAVNIDWTIGTSGGSVDAQGFAWNLGTSDGTGAGRLLFTGGEDLGTEDLPRFALMDGQSVQIGVGLLWMPGGFDAPMYCTGPGSTAKRIGDEAFLELSQMSLLGSCPGTPIEGEFQFCQGVAFEGCPDAQLDNGALAGHIDGIAIPSDTRYTLLLGSNTVTDVNTTLGLLRFETGASEGQISRGVVITGPDTVFGGNVYCFGESEVVTTGESLDEQSVYTFRNLAKLGTCVGASGSDSLTGCIR
jgi:hypothetical protein